MYSVMEVCSYKKDVRVDGCIIVKGMVWRKIKRNREMNVRRECRLDLLGKHQKLSHDIYKVYMK